MGRWPVSMGANPSKVPERRLISRHSISRPAASRTTLIMAGIAKKNRIIRVIAGIQPPPKTNFSQMPAPNPAMIAMSRITPLQCRRIVAPPAADTPVARGRRCNVRAFFH